MSPQEYAEFLRSKIQELRSRNKPFELAVKSTVAAVTLRAFTDKRNEKGESFQYNSTTPVYISQEQSPQKLTNRGKSGKSKFESGKKKGQEHKTTYFKSYKDFRAAVDRDTDAVDWQLNNDLRGDYGNSPKNTPPARLKPAVKIDVNHYLTQLSREENIKKYNGLVKRYGNFLQCSEPEEQYFFRINESELGKFLSE